MCLSENNNTEGKRLNTAASYLCHTWKKREAHSANEPESISTVHSLLSATEMMPLWTVTPHCPLQARQGSAVSFPIDLAVGMS